MMVCCAMRNEDVPEFCVLDRRRTTRDVLQWRTPLRIIPPRLEERRVGVRESEK